MVLICFKSFLTGLRLGACVFAFGPKSRRFRDPGRARAAARHAGHHGVIISSLRRFLSRSAADSRILFLIVSVVFMSGRVIRKGGADRLRSGPMRELLAP